MCYERWNSSKEILLWKQWRQTLHSSDVLMRVYHRLWSYIMHVLRGWRVFVSGCLWQVTCPWDLSLLPNWPFRSLRPRHRVCWTPRLRWELTSPRFPPNKGACFPKAFFDWTSNSSTILAQFLPQFSSCLDRPILVVLRRPNWANVGEALPNVWKRFISPNVGYFSFAFMPFVCIHSWKWHIKSYNHLHVRFKISAMPGSLVFHECHLCSAIMKTRC